MQKKFFLVVLVSSAIFAIGCGGSSGVAELQTYPAVTAEEQQVIDENFESLKDEAR